MRIALDLAFDENAAVRLLNWLALENARILRRYPNLPGLYESGVRYQREKGEIWKDYLNLLRTRWEDCDGLAAARAGEIMARGWRALGPEDAGYPLARNLRPRGIYAEVFLRTRAVKGESGVYHCLVQYAMQDRRGRWHWYEDDPSERLGMTDLPLPIEHRGQRNRRAA